MKTILLISICLITVLVGCENLITTEISLQDMISGSSKQIPGDLYVEIASCSDFSDSRKPSNSLIEAQKAAPMVFKDAAFIECFSKNFKSYAHFSISLLINRAEGASFPKIIDGAFNLCSNDDTMILAVAISKDDKKRFAQVKKQNLFSISDMKLNVRIKINNNTDSDYTVRAYSTYVDGAPSVNKTIILKQGSTTTLNLSDVSVDDIFYSENGALVLEKISK